MNGPTNRVTNEMFYQLVALLLSVVIIHTIYVSLIRPSADNIIRQQAEISSAGGPQEASRSFFIIIKDLEQESCFILMFWSLAIMGYKGRVANREKYMLSLPLVSLPEGTRIFPEDTSQLTRPLQALPREQRAYLLPRAIESALTRFQFTNSAQFATEAVSKVCDSEHDRMESELSMVRYITWAIPSIGFIGTVRGIGEALGQTYQAMDGNIAGVTSSLSIAFNSTFVALLISMVVMFFMHQLQLRQERLVLDCHAYCETKLLRFLKSPI
jgi:biopolymer transport protein ExbB/TolQ